MYPECHILTYRSRHDLPVTSILIPVLNSRTRNIRRIPLTREVLVFQVSQGLPRNASARLPDLQETQQEDGSYGDLLCPGHMQPGDIVHGQHQDGQVNHHVRDGVAQSQHCWIKTPARNSLVPRFLQRLTLSAREGGTGTKPRQRQRTQDDAPPPDNHEPSREYAPVHGEDGEFGEGQLDEVDPFHGEQCLKFESGWVRSV